MKSSKLTFRLEPILWFDFDCVSELNTSESSFNPKDGYMLKFIMKVICSIFWAENINYLY